MGKVTVIIEDETMDTSALERDVHALDFSVLEESSRVYIVPADEEWPDL